MADYQGPYSGAQVDAALKAATELQPKVTEIDGKLTEQGAKLTELSEENERLKERIEEQDQFIEDLQNIKIDRENDDYYPKMTVGTADNLAGVDVVDSEINFRCSGGGAITDGVARIEAIKGNSVVWNQLYNRTPFTTSGMTMTIDGNTTIINGVTTASYFGIKAGVRVSANKMLMVVQCLANPDGLSFNVADLNSAMAGIDVTASAPNGYAFYTGTYRADGNTLGIQRFGDVGTAFNNVKIVVSLYDLTKMFGAGNEPTTLEEYYQRKPLGVDDDAYNEGEVIHMDVQSIESQGVNAWDEEWELGQFDNGTGEPVPSTGHIRSKNYIHVIAGATYYCLGSFIIIYYDDNLKQVEWWSIGGARTLTLPNNVHYVKIYKTGTTYNHDICINLSDTAVNGKYFPYIKRVEDLSIIRKYFPQGMKSAGTAHDEIRYNKTTQKREKVVRIMKVDAGTLAWAQDAYNGKIIFKAYISGAKGPSSQVTKGAILCPRYSAITAAGIDTQDKSIASYYVAAGYECQVRVYDSAYTDLASFKNGVSGLDIYVEMLEPIITELDEADQFKDLDYQVWNAGTEKAIAEGKSAPLAADITYGFNAIGKIKELESLVAALRAKVGI